jgi:hypothetical protein
MRVSTIERLLSWVTADLAERRIDSPRLSTSPSQESWTKYICKPRFPRRRSEYSEESDF